MVLMKNFLGGVIFACDVVGGSAFSAYASDVTIYRRFPMVPIVRVFDRG